MQHAGVYEFKPPTPLQLPQSLLTRSFMRYNGAILGWLQLTDPLIAANYSRHGLQESSRPTLIVIAELGLRFLSFDYDTNIISNIETTRGYLHIRLELIRGT